MKLRDVATSTLRAWLIAAGSLLPDLARRARDELARRELDAREARRPMWAAARAQADLRADGFSAWLGLGGDA